MEAGTPLYVTDFPATVADAESTSGTTTSTSFTSTLTGGIACEVVFTAPTSGKVLVLNNCSVLNSGSANTYCGWRLGTGSTPGGGSQIVAPAESRSIRSMGTNQIRAGTSDLVTGLTAGLTYNVQQQFRVSSNTGTFAQKQLIVVPQPA